MRQLLFTLVVGIFLSSTGLAEVPENQVNGQTSVAISNETVVTKPVFISTQLSNQSLLVANHLIIDKPIMGDVLIVAGKVDLQSNIAGQLTLVAGQATLAGNIQGDVIAIGGNIDISSKAVINGNLKYLKSSSINIAPGATIKGKLEPWVRPSPVSKKPYVITTIDKPAYKFPWIFYGGLLVVGLVLCLGFAGYSKRLLNTVWQRPWLSLLSGLLVFIVTPMLILTAIMTIIGIPFSIVLFGLYLASLWLAYAYAAWLIGASLMRLIKASVDFNTKQSRILALLLGLASLYFLGCIPYIGFWLKGFALLLGLGGMALTFRLAWSQYVNN